MGELDFVAVILNRQGTKPGKYKYLGLHTGRKQVYVRV